MFGWLGASEQEVHEQPADLRYRQRDHVLIAVSGSPFVAACARAAASQARASMDRVMWAYQARQKRTW